MSINEKEKDSQTSDPYGWGSFADSLANSLGNSVNEVMNEGEPKQVMRSELKKAIAGIKDGELTGDQEARAYDSLWYGAYNDKDVSEVFAKEPTPYQTITAEDFKKEFGHAPSIQYGNTLYKDEYMCHMINGAAARKLFSAATEKDEYNPDEIRMNLFKVASFYEDYPTAFDFARANDIPFDKVDATLEEQRAFISTMYGDKQLEYLEQLRDLREEAHERVCSGRFRPKVENMESGEKLYFDVATRVISINQVDQDYEDDLFEDGTSQDAVYINGGENVFAVFDGMGGVDGDSRVASHQCVENLSRWADDIDITTESGKQTLISSLSNAVTEGAATATIVKVVKDEYGQRFAHYVSVGDSRLYCVHKDHYVEDRGDGTYAEHIDPFVEQLTKDDDCSKDQILQATRKQFPDWSEEDLLTLYDWVAEKPINRQLTRTDGYEEVKKCIFGMMYHGVTKGVGVGSNHKVSAGNAGVIRLDYGDSLILCSDGVYGSTPKEQLSADEISEAVYGKSANDSLESLMKKARKSDDRSAIVVKF